MYIFLSDIHFYIISEQSIAKRLKETNDATQSKITELRVKTHVVNHHIAF